MPGRENEAEGGSGAGERKTYMRYSREVRLRLIQLVDEEQLPTAEAARILGVKQTSACRIMKSYHCHNRIFERKNDRLRREAGLPPHPVPPQLPPTPNPKQMTPPQTNCATPGTQPQPLPTPSGLQPAQNVGLVGVWGENWGKQNILLPSVVPMGSGFYPLYMPGVWGMTYGGLQ